MTKTQKTIKPLLRFPRVAPGRYRIQYGEFFLGHVERENGHPYSSIYPDGPTWAVRINGFKDDSTAWLDTLKDAKQYALATLATHAVNGWGLSIVNWGKP